MAVITSKSKPYGKNENKAINTWSVSLMRVDIGGTWSRCHRVDKGGTLRDGKKDQKGFDYG